MDVAQAILHGLGYAGDALPRCIDGARRRATLDAALAPLRAAAARLPRAARPRFAVAGRQAQRRSTSRSTTWWSRRRERARSDRAAGRRRARSAASIVDKDTCTLCLACVGACPERAAGQPERAAAALHREELRAVRPVRETCPEHAITLQPRLLLPTPASASSRAC